MDEKETQRLAVAVDALRRKVGPQLRGEENLVAAIALTGMAAHHVLHDDGTEEDFLLLCRVAWKKSVEAHSDGCSN